MTTNLRSLNGMNPSDAHDVRREEAIWLANELLATLQKTASSFDLKEADWRHVDSMTEVALALEAMLDTARKLPGE